MRLLVEMLPEHNNLIKLKEEVSFLESIIENLLLSDRLSLPYSKLDLNKFRTDEIVRKVIEMFPINRKNININNSIPDEEIFVDETKFNLALRNLLDNAFKYSLPNANVELSISKKDDVEFQVKDFGRGVSDKNIKKITEPFYQTDQTSSAKGFGLGLTICKKIIESHKGRLSIYSKPGEGSVFTLHLPAI